MTETFYYFDLVNHTEATESEFHKIMMARDGYLVGSGSELAVIQNTPPAMNVVVGTGKAWIDGGEYINPAPKTVTIEAADATYTRIDRVVVQVDWVANTALAAIHKGVAAATPVAPTLTQTSTLWEFPLATVTIPTNSVSITTAMLADERVNLNGTSISFNIDGGGAVIATGIKGTLEVPFACTITGWALLADAAGSMVVNVKKSTYAGYPTTASITGTALPTLATAQKGTGTTLTGWTTTVAMNDILVFVVNSCTTITRATLVLHVTVTG
jgi:hypothetical protein